MSRHGDTRQLRIFIFSFNKCTRMQVKRPEVSHALEVQTRALSDLCKLNLKKNSQSERPCCLSLLDPCPGVTLTVLRYFSSPPRMIGQSPSSRRSPYNRCLPCKRISPHGLSIVVCVSCDLAVGHAEFLAILHQRFAVPACSVHDVVRECALTTSEVCSSQRPASSLGLPLVKAHAHARAKEHEICTARSLQHAYNGAHRFRGW